MACFFGHKWNGCKCERCNMVRDEQHDWDLCKGKCKRCHKVCDEEHDWDGCKCLRCGKKRDKQHSWNGCRCSVCLKENIDAHVWDNCVCARCGKLREHTWQNGICSRCGTTEEELAFDICRGHIRSYPERRKFRIYNFHYVADITNQTMLCELTKSRDFQVRSAAFNKITDADVLKQIAFEQERPYEIRIKAAKQITDKKLQEEVINNMPGMSPQEIQDERMKQIMYDIDIRNGM